MCEDVEDEIHFVLKCPMYVKERAKMFSKIRQECNLIEVENMDEEWQFKF